MILVDSRAGSKDLVRPLVQMGLDVEETTLDFGDLAFSGRGEGGAPLLIGIEHKKVSDLLQSMTTGRLQGHQLLGMVNSYDRRYLIIEGDWDHDSQGHMTMFKRRGERHRVKGAPPAVDLEKRIITLETRGGITTRYTQNRRGSLRAICALYRFWTDKDLDAHKSHLAVYAPDMDRSLAVPVSDLRRILAQVPGIGYSTSGAVERYCKQKRKGPLRLTEEEWAEIENVSEKGRKVKLGQSRARHIMEALAALR